MQLKLDRYSLIYFKNRQKGYFVSPHFITA